MAIAALAADSTALPDPDEYTPRAAVGAKSPYNDPLREKQAGSTKDGSPIYEDSFGNQYIYERGTNRRINLGELPAQQTQDYYRSREIAQYIGLGPTRSGEGMLGINGTQINSSTVWKGGSDGRIDVENPAPGERTGQIHWQDPGNNVKYYYDTKYGYFYDRETNEPAPRYVQNLLKNQKVKKAIEKALRYLGE